MKVRMIKDNAVANKEITQRELLSGTALNCIRLEGLLHQMMYFAKLSKVKPYRF